MMTMNSKKKRVVGIGIGALAAVLIAVAVVSSTPQIAQTIIPFVTVSGTVTTTGPATAPLSIDFKSDKGAINSATVKEDGTYSIILANQHSYSTTVHYSAGYGITSGACDAGKIDIYTSSMSMDRNLSC
jgi:hypothetical protein